MSRRDVIIPPFYQPGGTLCPVDIEFQLVDENRDPVVGMRVADDEGVTCQLVLTTTDQDQTTALTPQDGVYGNTFWRIRIGLTGSANIPLSSRCAKYDEYFVSFADGAPIELSDLLNLAGPGVPGTSPGWEQHLEDPTFSQLHNPSDATDQQVPVWDNAQQKWVAADQAAQGPPLAHAASHATGGTDELTPAAIGSVEEAPDDGVIYSRQAEMWTPTPISPIGGVSLDYRWDADTTATDPTAGRVKVNNVDHALATELYVNGTTQPGNDASFIWNNFQAGDYVGIWETGSDHEGIYYELTSGATDNGGWFTFTVSAIPTTVGGMENSRPVLVFSIADPTNKLPAGGTTGQHLVKQTDNNYDTAWETAPNAVEESGESLVQGLSIAVVDAVPGVQTAGVIYFVRSAP